MTHYYYDADNNVFYQIDRMPPREPENNEEMISDKGLQKEWGEFYIYLLGRPKESHTFNGHSRVVPEGEIEWRYEWLNGSKLGVEQWEPSTYFHYENSDKSLVRRVATPKITAQPDKPEDSLLDIAKSMYESAKKLLEKLK